MFSFIKDSIGYKHFNPIYVISCVLLFFALLVFAYLLINVFFNEKTNLSGITNITLAAAILNINIAIGYLIMPLIYYGSNESSKIPYDDTFRIKTNIFVKLGLITCLITFFLSVIIVILL